MSLTTPQILKLARKKILEETTEIVDDETLLIYGNLTQDDIGIRTFPESAVKSTSIVFTAGVGVLPSDFGTLYGDPQENAYNVYPELSIQDFGRITTGNAVTIREGSIYCYPVKNVTLQIKYYPSFVQMSIIQNPTIDPYFHELIIYGILFRAYEDLQDEELSKYYEDKYEAKFTTKRNAKSQYEESSQRGGSMFNEIPIIGGYTDGLDPNHW